MPGHCCNSPTPQAGGCPFPAFIRQLELECLYQVGRIFFAYEPHIDSFCLELHSFMSSGPVQRTLSALNRSLTCLHPPPLSTAPPQDALLLRRHAGNAPFKIARNRSVVGRSEIDTSRHTSRISYTAHFHIARGGEIVLACSRSTGNERITAVTTSTTVTLPKGVKSRHTTPLMS